MKRAPAKLDFVIYIDSPSQNQWQIWHFGKRMRLKANVKKLLKATLRLMGYGHGRLAMGRRAHITFHRYGWNTLDASNVSGGLKGVLDTIVRIGLLVDDSPRWITEEYHQSIDRRGKRRVHITIEYEETAHVA